MVLPWLAYLKMFEKIEAVHFLNLVMSDHELFVDRFEKAEWRAFYKLFDYYGVFL